MSAMLDAPAVTRATPDAKGRVEIILNASAGGGDNGQAEAREQILSVLAALGETHARVSVARDGAEIIELARRAAEAVDVRLVVAGGGDGTINAVASALVGSDKPLGVLPLGTLNHFAKDLKLPLELDAAVRLLITGQAQRVDVGEVNGRIFLNNSSLGLYPEIVRRREHQQQRGRGKWVAFVAAAFTVLRRFPSLRVRLSVDGREFARDTPFVFVGNNKYEMDGFNLGARSCLNEGQLSLHFTRGQPGRWGLVRFALRALAGRLPQDADFDALCAKEIHVATHHRRHLRVATDGEVNVMNTPLEYRARAGALLVMMPQTNDERGTMNTE